eukprot:evm.model.NODE_23078_length_13312_cov_30.534330.1
MGSYETWNGIVVRETGGFAITESRKLFRLDIDSTSTTSASLVPKTSTPLAWRSMDSSNDGEIAVAVVHDGNVYTSNDSGETWTSQPGPGIHPWIAVTVSENGKRRVALSSDGQVCFSAGAGGVSVSGLCPCPDCVRTPLTGIRQANNIKDSANHTLTRGIAAV